MAKKRPFPKAVLWIGLALFLLIAPLVLLSNGMMGVYQDCFDAKPGSRFRRWLQLASADACRSTWRPEMAADRYRAFVDACPEDERRREALFRFAVALEESEKTADALAVYQRYAREYPDHPDARAARAAVDRLRHMKAQ